MTTNVDVVASAYEAMNRGDIPAVLAVMDDEIEFSEAEHSPYWAGAPFRGPQDVLEHVFRRLGDDFTHFRIDVERLVDAGDVVVGQVRYHGTANASGRDLDAQAAHVFDLRDGKVIRLQQYLDTWQSADVTGQVGGAEAAGADDPDEVVEQLIATIR